jgi:threonine dehydratase
MRRRIISRLANIYVMASLHDQLFEEILRARQRVYAAGGVTPLERLELGLSQTVFCKREDLGPIRSYKWRGAFNRMALLTTDERARGVVAASAGNHAQGVALAARQLGSHALIYMPVATPEMKQRAVARHGGDAVDIVLTGDSYDEAAAAAQAVAREDGRPFIHPYDDLGVMGGQGTLADEIVMSGAGPFTRAYVQIGGGGLAAATACWLKRYFPHIRIIGVEGVDQASMQRAVAAGGPVTLEYLDVFCDGTAVRQAGALTWQLCRDLVDEFITVTNDEVCQAVRVLWDANRSIPEPAGAMGLAGFLQQAASLAADERVLTILCGANMDFSQLAVIARHAGIGSKLKRFLRVRLPERPGALADFLSLAPPGVNVIDLQVGKSAPDVSLPVFGFAGTAEELAAFEATLAREGIPREELDGAEDVDYRIIAYQPELISNPLFVHVEFPERAGALLGFMREMRDKTNLVYFNYAYTGERVGRALIGMEFASEADRGAARPALDALCGHQIRAWREISRDALRRILAQG